MRGACRGLDSSVFFHPDGERGSNRAAREARAKHVCQACPVQQQCRRHALAVREPYGIWGGLSRPERDALVRDDPALLQAQHKAAAPPRDRGAIRPSHTHAGASAEQPCRPPARRARAEQPAAARDLRSPA